MKSSVDAMISAATQINSFLILGGVLALAAILAKLFIRNNNGTVKIAGVDLPLNHTWIAMSLITLAHAYYAWSMLVEVARLLNCHDSTLSHTAWKELTGDADKLRVMFQMSEREPVTWWPGCLPISNVLTVGFTDTLLIMHTLLVAGVFFATVRWFRVKSWRLRILTTVAALVLVLSNWFVGSQWALLASDLARSGRGEPREAMDLADYVASHADVKCVMR